MMDETGAYWYHAHPRTKGTTGYPDMIFDKPHVKDDRYLGLAFKPGMGQDNSEERMCEWRCFDATDTMNNLYANSGSRPKYIIAEGEFFVTTGEILIKNYGVTGVGDKRTVAADLEWTYPLSFLEVVWGDGKTIDRQIIAAKDLGAFVQPVWLNAPPTTQNAR